MTETQARIQEAQHLLRNNEPRRAEQAMQALLETEPDNTEAQYALAVAQRHQHRWMQAISSLSKILSRQPRFGRAYQEVGYNHVALEQYSRAGAAFEKAVSADPSLVNSWKCLVKLYRDAGNREKQAAAQEQVDFLSGLPPELLGVISYLSDDKLLDAERLCKHFLRTEKTHAEGMRLLAEIATRNKVYNDAEFLLESCVEFHPEHIDARIQYANLLLRIQKFSKALEQAELLLERYPDDRDRVLSLYANACTGVGKNETAIESYGKLMEAHPQNHFFPVSLGHVHKTDGDMDKAVALYRQAYTIKRDHGDAWWSLANTKTHRFTDTELAQMAEIEADPATGEEDRIQLCFALGNAYENRREYEHSFDYYHKGNALKQQATYHSTEQLQARVDSQVATCTEELFSARQGVGSDVRDPVFIVGLPRSGSTLLEQILSSHSQVDGTMELHNILNLAKRLRGRDRQAGAEPGYPRILAEIDIDYFRRFGEQFIQDSRAYRGAAPFFIDKMPNNFFHIGLIRLILPNARVIDARRNPMACCFSCFKQLFGEGQEFSYGLREVGHYYRAYVQLMDHWDRVLPGFVLRVMHEDVVNDLETQVRRILDFCGLPFEEACLNFHETERSVRTPSSEQVRQPIYRSGLEQWRNFEPWLAPLKEALGTEILGE